MKNKLMKLELTPSNMSETLLVLLQSAMHEKCGAIDSIMHGFPLSPLPYHDDYQGGLWCVVWNGDLKAVIRSAHADSVRELALNYCQNTGSAFVSVDKADFEKQSGYHRAPNGKTVTTKLLEVEPLTWELYLQHKFRMVLRLEMPFDYADAEQLNIESNEESNESKNPFCS